MKITTAEQQRGYIDSTIVGGIKGALVATGISLPTHFLLKRGSHIYRNLPLSLRTFLFVTISVPCITISAEKAGEAYDRSQWTGAGQRELDSMAMREQMRWQEMSTRARMGDWAKRNKYGIIGFSWAGAMAGSFAIVSRNKYQSFSQKLVQARVYAQAVTIVMLLAAAILSGTKTEKDAPDTDHSWREILEQEGYLNSDKERMEQLRGAANNVTKSQ